MLSCAAGGGTWAKLAFDSANGSTSWWAALQCGDQPSVWLPLPGQRKCWPVTAGDSKTVTVLIEKNPYPATGRPDPPDRAATSPRQNDDLSVERVLGRFVAENCSPRQGEAPQPNRLHVGHAARQLWVERQLAVGSEYADRFPETLRRY